MKTRNEVAENLKWKTEHLFDSLETWNALYDDVKSRLDFSKYEGKLGEKQSLLAFYKELYEVVYDLEKLYIFVHLKTTENTKDALYNGLVQRASVLYVQLSSATAFVTPELTALDEKTLKAFIADPDFADYDYELKLILKGKPHVLSKETESVLSLSGQVMGSFHDIFSMIDNAELPFPTVKIDGEKQVISHGVYGVMLHHPSQKVRKEVFTKYYHAYKSLLKTISATYAGNVYKNVFIAKARKYDSCLQMALANEDVDVKVYKNLLSAVKKALPQLHRYVKLKKRALGLRTMHMYDIYMPTVENCELKLDYEDAFKLVKEGLAPLGEDYAKLLQTAHDEGWIDVEETDGKRSGAFSASVYACPHPYVLLNYQKTTSDVFTIAHELGHSMHTYYSNANQPQSKADYKIFVAEVASTVNEVLLLKYLLKTTNDLRLKKYLLSYYTDMIKGTLFRQTMFAEFEYIAHNMAAEGQPMTDESLSKEYLALNKKYYGRSVVSDDEISYEWARIPHFYTAFYVYKYATGIISAISIAERIYKFGDPAVKEYKKFLSSGGSDSPVELLKLAGVDLTKPDAYELAMQSFKAALDEMESIEL